MRILAPPPFLPPLTTTHHNAEAATGTGTDATVSGFGTAIVEVVVSATATVYLYARSNSSGSYRLIPIQDANGHFIESIKATGFYRVNIAGYEKLRVSISANTGTVTARSTCVQMPSPPDGVSLRRRNTMIADSGSVVVAAGASVSAASLLGVDRVDLRDYAFIYFGVDAGADHTTGWTLDLLWTWYDNSGPRFSEYADGIVLSQTARRATSEWLEVKSPGITARITNNDAISQTYRIILFGIR